MSVWCLSKILNVKETVILEIITLHNSKSAHYLWNKKVLLYDHQCDIIYNDYTGSDFIQRKTQISNDPSVSFPMASIQLYANEASLIWYKSAWWNQIAYISNSIVYLFSFIQFEQWNNWARFIVKCPLWINTLLTKTFL